MFKKTIWSVSLTLLVVLFGFSIVKAGVVSSAIKGEDVKIADPLIESEDVKIADPLIYLVDDYGKGDNGTGWTPNGPNVYKTYMTGSVGIGTTAPGSPLTVIGATGTAKNAIVGTTPGYTVSGVIQDNIMNNGGQVGVLGAANRESALVDIPLNPMGSGTNSMGVFGLGASYGNNNSAGGAFIGQEYGYGQGTVYGVWSKAMTKSGITLDHNQTYYGVYSLADSTNDESGLHTSTLYGVMGSALGAGFDTTYGGYFSATGGTRNFGLYSATGTNYFNGSVGIGTTGPGKKLALVKDSIYDSETTFGLEIKSSDITNYDTGLHLGVDSANDLGFIQTKQSSSWTSRALALNPNGGRVGIGLTNPATTLDVSGNLTVSGSNRILNFSDAVGSFYIQKGGADLLSVSEPAGGTALKPIAFSGGYISGSLVINPSQSRLDGSLFVTDPAPGDNQAPLTTPHGLFVVQRHGPTTYTTDDNIGAGLFNMTIDTTRSIQPGAAYGGRFILDLGNGVSGPYTPTNNYGLVSEVNHYGTSTVAEASAGFFRVNTLGGGGTITTAKALQVGAPSISSGPIATMYGLYIDSLTGAVNNYALYAAGTTKSYFGGNVGIGTTNPNYKLDVSGSIHGTSYYSGDGTAGVSAKINLTKAKSGGTCTMTIKNGLITATTCQ